LKAVPQAERSGSTGYRACAICFDPVRHEPEYVSISPAYRSREPHLRKFAAAPGPAYVRVSGTWANSVYFADSDNSQDKAPAGFSGVLARKEWKGVIDFVHAVNGELDFIRDERRYPQCARLVVSKRGKRVACVYKVHWRANRCDRVHERADLRCHGRSTQKATTPLISIATSSCSSCYGDPLRLALAGCTHVGTIAFRG